MIPHRPEPKLTENHGAYNRDLCQVMSQSGGVSDEPVNALTENGSRGRPTDPGNSEVRVSSFELVRIGIRVSRSPVVGRGPLGLPVRIGICLCGRRQAQTGRDIPRPLNSQPSPINLIAAHAE